MSNSLIYNLQCNVLAIMDYKGIGQSELAKLSGISRSSIQKLLNGRTEQMSLNNLQSIGIYFHLLTDELLNEDDVDYVKDLVELRKDYLNSVII